MQVSTKLNRSHLVHGRQALILPCLGRTEKDHQRERPPGRRRVEDSMSMVHLSHGMKEPGVAAPALGAGDHRRHGAGHACPESKTPWQDYVDDYDRIRDTMAAGARRLRGLQRARPPAARLPHRASRRASASSLTPSGRAEFSHRAAAGRRRPGDGRLILGTMRSHDQWNTTIYSNDDRYRGVKNLRTLVFMNADDMQERGLEEFDLVDITSIAKDGTQAHRARLPRRPRTTSRPAARPATCRS